MDTERGLRCSSMCFGVKVVLKVLGGLGGSEEMNVTNERRYVVRVLKLIGFVLFNMHCHVIVLCRENIM